MDTVMVSPRYQVVIPHTVRAALNIRPGQKMRVVRYANRIELLPLRMAKSMRGFLKGIDTSIEREPDRL